ncbi:hypothetical protein JCM10212_003005 [Sporobolomyces blumeae]
MHPLTLVATVLCVVAIVSSRVAVKAAPSTSIVRRASDDDGGLSKDSALTDSQVTSIKGILNRTASLSWEIGTHLEALVEYDTPALGPYAASFDSVSPSTSPVPYNVLEIVSYISNNNPPSSDQLQIVRDGSAADPASIAPFYVLANWTLEGGAGSNDVLPTNSSGTTGVGKARLQESVENQVTALLERTPRTSDGAISHRTDSTELWSDFVYMVPPFLAYYGVMTKNTSMLDDAYNQCKLYRQYLRDDRTGLWRHIAMGDSPDPGLWSTGNGWAANGMLRTLSSLRESSYKDDYSDQTNDLVSWVGEIVTGAWAQPQSGGLLYNYLNETSSFADCSGTALLSAATFRLATVISNHSSSTALTAAERAYQTVTSTSHLSTPQAVLHPVVNPMDYSSELTNVKLDASGKVSPEGEAFVLLMESARRDWIRGGGDVGSLGVASNGNSGGGGGSGAGSTRVDRTVLVASLGTGVLGLLASTLLASA